MPHCPQQGQPCLQPQEQCGSCPQLSGVFTLPKSLFLSAGPHKSQADPVHGNHHGQDAGEDGAGHSVEPQEKRQELGLVHMTISFFLIINLCLTIEEERV